MAHEFKGTPGPWKVEYDDNGFYYVDSTSAFVSPYIAATGGEIWDDKHNAHLIAAAPDLLEALQNLVQLKEWKDRNGKDEHYEKAQPIAWDVARAAISKALNHEL